MNAPAARRDPAVTRVFVGLLLGMLTASLNLMLIAPVMPTIAADLGGLDHYTWLALSSMLSSTVVTPVVGKLSDTYGRKRLYILSALVLAAGSALSGAAPNFEFLLLARVIQGVGIGSVFVLSLTIIADIISPLERGKYQSMMGAMYGAAALLGPLAGGQLAEHLSWRWLFFLNIPLCLLTAAIVQTNLRLPAVKAVHPVDVMGIGALTLALVSFLIATDLSATHFASYAPQILGLFGFAAAITVLFIIIETRVVDPVMPLRLWSSPVFTLANIANMGVAVCMFSTMYFIPMFVQGVMGSSAAQSGMTLVPMTLTSVMATVVGGQLISRTGRYKLLTLCGLATMGVSFWLMTLMDAQTSSMSVMRNLLLLGLGMGVAVQNFRLIIQNSAAATDLGVATGTTELFRAIAAAASVGVMGSLMTLRLQADLAAYLPSDALDSLHASRVDLGIATALDPERLSQLPPAVVRAVRDRFVDALRPVFIGELLCTLVAFAAALFIREVPLRKTAHVSVKKAA